MADWYLNVVIGVSVFVGVLFIILATVVIYYCFCTKRRFKARPWMKSKTETKIYNHYDNDSLSSLPSLSKTSHVTASSGRFKPPTLEKNGHVTMNTPGQIYGNFYTMPNRRMFLNNQTWSTRYPTNNGTKERKVKRISKRSTMSAPNRLSYASTLPTLRITGETNRPITGSSQIIASPNRNSLYVRKYNRHARDDRNQRRVRPRPVSASIITGPSTVNYDMSNGILVDGGSHSTSQYHQQTGLDQAYGIAGPILTSANAVTQSDISNHQLSTYDRVIKSPDGSTTTGPVLTSDFEVTEQGVTSPENLSNQSYSFPADAEWQIVEH